MAKLASPIYPNFISLVQGEKRKVPYPEQRIICEFLTKKRFSLNDLMDFPDSAYDRITLEWKNSLHSSTFIPVLDCYRKIIRNKRSGQNILRYLLHTMNNVIIKNQRGGVPNSNLTNLYLANGCKQFDSLPFNRSPLGHNPKLSAVFECIPCEDKHPELFARFIRNTTEGKGQLFTDINNITDFKDIKRLIRKYNDSLWLDIDQKVI